MIILKLLYPDLKIPLVKNLTSKSINYSLKIIPKNEELE
jgi:hypothetical protein